MNTRFNRCIQVIAMDGMYAGFAGAKTGHAAMALLRCLFQPVFHFHFWPRLSFTTLGRCDLNSVLAVRRKYAMKPGEVNSWFGD